jgi:hypothetical protein
MIPNFWVPPTQLKAVGSEVSGASSPSPKKLAQVVQVPELRVSSLAHWK